MKTNKKGKFDCGCGKSFPYYSSLYKHIQGRAHNGIAPPGTFKSQNKQGRKCGRDTPMNYQCGCGKKFHSYQGMKDHIKSKHEGVRPAGTIVIQNAKGRPANTFKRRKSAKAKQVPVVKRAVIKRFDGDKKPI